MRAASRWNYSEAPLAGSYLLSAGWGRSLPLRASVSSTSGHRSQISFDSTSQWATWVSPGGVRRPGTWASPHRLAPSVCSEASLARHCGCLLVAVSGCLAGGRLLSEPVWIQMQSFSTSPYLDQGGAWSAPLLRVHRGVRLFWRFLQGPQKRSSRCIS